MSAGISDYARDQLGAMLFTVLEVNAALADTAEPLKTRVPTRRAVWHASKPTTPPSRTGSALWPYTTQVAVFFSRSFMAFPSRTNTIIRPQGTFCFACDPRL